MGLKISKHYIATPPTVFIHSQPNFMRHYRYHMHGGIQVITFLGIGHILSKLWHFESQTYAWE